MRSKATYRRLDRLARRQEASQSAAEITEEQRLAFCIKHGLELDSVLIGNLETGVVVLPPETEE